MQMRTLGRVDGFPLMEAVGDSQTIGSVIHGGSV